MNESKNCVINLWNEQGWKLDAGMLKFAMIIAARHAENAKEINIYPQERIPADAPAYKWPGSIEWSMNVANRGEGILTIGLLQRTPDSVKTTYSKSPRIMTMRRAAAT